MRTNNVPDRRTAQERRRTEAQERQQRYDDLPDDEKIRRNPTKRGPA